MLKRYMVAVHDKDTLDQVGMVCVEAKSADEARGIGIRLIEKHKQLERINPNVFASLVIETYSLAPGSWN